MTHVPSKRSPWHDILEDLSVLRSFGKLAEILVTKLAGNDGFLNVSPLVRCEGIDHLFNVMFNLGRTDLDTVQLRHELLVALRRSGEGKERRSF
jgi:hypothetical protein